ncbi:MAG: sodium:solute symporter family protein [Pseudonocardia sediminis]
MTGDAAVSLGILTAFMVLACLLGIRAGRGRRGKDGDDLAEWSLGGRSLGFLFTLLLTAGETYTTFSYLGAAGWAYDNGISALYVVAYLGIGMAVSYVVAPILWTYAQRHGLHSIADIAAHRFGAPWLNTVVAVVATILVLPYIQLQITGMGVVVASVGYGAIGLGVSYLVAFLIAETFVLVSGLRGSAWVSALKDVLVLVTLAAVFVYVPLHFFGGYGELMTRLVEQREAWLTLPGPDDATLGVGWFASTVLLNAVVFCIFPPQVAGFLGAASPQVLRRNAMVLPLYQVLLFVPVVLGMAALFVVPGLGDSNQAMFELVRQAMPAWALGFVGAAGALSAIVPMAMFMLVIGTMWGPVIRGTGRAAEVRRRRLAQVVTLAAGVVALAMTYLFPNALVRLSLISYEGMAQLLPLVLLALFWRRMPVSAALAGLGAGLVVDVVLVASGNDPLGGVNAGVVALAVNLLVVTVITRLRPADTAEDRLAQPEAVPVGRAVGRAGRPAGGGEWST